MERPTRSSGKTVHDHGRALSPIDGDIGHPTQHDDEQLLVRDEEDSSGQATPPPLLLQKPVAAWAVSGLGLLFLLVVIIVVRGGTGSTRPRTQVATATGTEWLAMLPQDMVVHMDPTVDPCVDFYEFSCGAWLDQVEIPDDKSSYSLSFTTVHDENQAVLKQLMSQGWPLVGELYDSCMNYSNISSAAADEASVKVLSPGLQLIAATKTKKQLLHLAGNLSRAGPSLLTSLGVAADAKNATIHALYASQTGLSLPDPEYYLNKNKFAAVHDAFRACITELFRLVGLEPHVAAAQAGAVISFQQMLAPLYVPKEKVQDPVATYNRMSVAKAADLYPLLFGAFVKGIGLLSGFLANQTDVIVKTPGFFARAEALIASESVTLDTLKAMLQYQYISYHAMTLSASFVTTTFDFFAKTLGGQKTLPARWKVCLQFVTRSFPELVGKYYTLLRLDDASEQLANDLVTHVQATLQQTLGSLAWLDDSTRSAAILKLRHMTNLIGHSKHKKHFPIELRAEHSLAENMQLIATYEFTEAVSKIGHPVDRTQWSMTSAAANAYYQPTANQIVFPAGILQRPFFAPTYHAARNFGSIGSVIGHELTHGFDAQGRYFDADGNLDDWWSRATATEFSKRTECLVAQYSSYEVPSDLEKDTVLGYVNGNYTLSENIADNGGVKLAFAAYTSFHGTHASDELSAKAADRLFFLSYAQLFCAKSRDASMTQRLASDPHAPGRWRINGVASNSQEFATAYSCPAGSAMNRAQKCRLW